MNPIDPKPRYAHVSRLLDDGRVVDVVPLTFGRARIIISPNENLWAGWTDGW